jgi:hypothetical protein
MPQAKVKAFAILAKGSAARISTSLGWSETTREWQEKIA